MFFFSFLLKIEVLSFIRDNWSDALNLGNALHSDPDCLWVSARCFLFYFLSCLSAAVPRLCRHLHWPGSLPQPGCRSTIGNYFIAIRRTGSVKGAATAVARQQHPHPCLRRRHVTPPVHADTLENCGCWRFSKQLVVFSTEKTTLKENLKVEFVP